MWVSEWWCSGDAMCCCALGCVLTCWTPFCSHEQSSFHCLQHVFRGTCRAVTRGLSKHGDPEFLQFCFLNQNPAVLVRGGGQGCIRREGTSEAAPEALRQAVGGGCQSGWGRLLSVTNGTSAGRSRQGDSGWV